MLKQPLTRIILNPAAGAGRAARRVAMARPVLEAAWPDSDWRVSRSARHITELAAEAAQAGYAQVIVAGGDGSAHFAANGLLGSDTALGILPLGSGNDIARSVGLPRDPLAAARILIQGRRRGFDVGRAGDRHFYCLLGAGLDTPALRRINASRLPRGRLLYNLQAVRTLFDYRAQRLGVRPGSAGFQPAGRQDAGAPGGFDGPVLFAGIANTPTYAGNIPIAPGADTGDGLFDVCVIPDLPLWRRLYAFARLKKGAHTTLPEIRTYRCATLELRGDLPVTLDGELSELRTPLRIDILPQALQVLGNFSQGETA